MSRPLLALVLVFALVLTGCGEKVQPTATMPPPTDTLPPPPTATQPPPPTATFTVPPPPTDTPTPTSSPTPEGIYVAAPRSVEVTALWYGQDANGQPTGGTSNVRISVEPNASGQFRVGFFEGEVGGSGPMWRASGWMATIMSALLTGFSPTQTQVSFDVGGRIDGPSAGGLMTIGVLAALRGDQIREDAAMTGTINPDGTIGPVGGIPYKIQGAASAGKKLVLIPVGRVEGGVNLIEHGRKLNVEVREVSDIYVAYEALTGKSLPRTVSTERPQLSGPIYDRMNAKAKEWLARSQEADALYNALPDTVKYFDDFIVAARTAGDRSTRLASQGMVAGAYGQAIDSATYAALAAHIGRILELYLSQGLDGVAKQLGATQAFDTKVAAIADRLKAEEPRTLAGASALISAYGVLIKGLGLADSGVSVLKQTANATSEEELVNLIVVASMYLRMADLDLEIVKDILDLASGLGGMALPADAPLNMVADFFRRAAEANLNLFDTVVLEPAAQPRGMSLDAFRNQFAAVDFVYAQARSGLLVMPRVLERYFGGGAASAYAQLGGALAAYSASTGLIAKYYSLDAQLDESLNIVGYGKERSLLDTLDMADEQARGSIAFLRQNGVDAALSIVVYESARLTREGNVSEKMDALTSFWDVYIHARALAYLGGLAGK